MSTKSSDQMAGDTLEHDDNQKGDGCQPHTGMVELALQGVIPQFYDNCK